MAQPTDIHARLFWRVAQQRLEDGQTILAINRPSAATYLAGYAVECVLKALLICSTPVGQRALIVASFRGAKWHDPVFLFEKLRAIPAGPVPPPAGLMREVTLVGTWSTDLRYEAGPGHREDATRFVKSVESIVEWADGKMN